MKTALLTLMGFTALLHMNASGVIQPADTNRPPLQGTMHDFTLETPPAPAPETPFYDEKGDKLDFSAFRGKVALVNLWATWCGPCVHEMPTLARLKQQREDARFTVVTISEDRGGAAAVNRFMAAHGFTGLDRYLDPHGALGDALGIEGIPTTLLIDRDGRILGRFEGDADWSGPDAAALIDWALGKSGATKLPAIEPTAYSPSSAASGPSGVSAVSTR